jgi:uncharacterized tellurite resistance protein B-like protein
MFPTTLTQPQREATFDLLLLGMYADDKLRLAENEQLYNLLSPYGWESYLDPQKYSELATARARAAHETENGTTSFLMGISVRLEDDDVRKLALALLARLIEADHEATESEADYYQQARTAFGL